jgi:hypothetical protein
VREALIVAAQELRSSVLGLRAVLAVGVYGLVSLGAGALVRAVVAKIVSGLPGGLTPEGLAQSLTNDEKFRESVRPALTWLGGDTLVKLVESGQLPWLALGVLVLSTFTLPGLVLLVGYDRISHDLEVRFSRYLFQRVHRGSYLLGRVIGHWATMMLAVVVVHGFLIVISSDLPGNSIEETMAVLPRVWTGMAILLFGYASYTAMFSVFFRPPFLALALGTLGLVAAWVMSLAERFHDLWLGTWDVKLFVLDPAALGVYAAYTALFLGIAYAGLRWRDV